RRLFPGHRLLSSRELIARTDQDPQQATASTMTIPAADYIRAIAPYQPGMPISELARRYGLEESAIVKLASNENPLGMPASARAAVIASLAEGARYPDGNGFDLNQALSAA